VVKIDPVWLLTRPPSVCIQAPKPPHRALSLSHPGSLIFFPHFQGSLSNSRHPHSRIHLPHLLWSLTPTPENKEPTQRRRGCQSDTLGGGSFSACSGRGSAPDAARRTIMPCHPFPPFQKPLPFLPLVCQLQYLGTCHIGPILFPNSVAQTSVRFSMT
jgi:hypothetical protein